MASTGVAGHWCSRWCHAATGCTDRQRRSGSRAAELGAHARPALSLDHRSACCAAAWAHAEVSSRNLIRHSSHPSHPSSGQESQASRLLHQGLDVRTVLWAPVMRSSSQWPGTIRVVTSASCSVIGIMFGCGRTNQFAEADAGWPCRPVAGRPVAKRRQNPIGLQKPRLEGRGSLLG